jgi:hypothetical protein
LRARSIEIRDCYAGTFRRERFGGRKANTAGRAGDEHGLAVETPAHSATSIRVHLGTRTLVM